MLFQFSSFPVRQLFPSSARASWGRQTSATADATVPYLTGLVANYSTAANFTKYGNVTLGTSTQGVTLAANGAGSGVVIRGGKLVQVGAGAAMTANSKVAIQGDSFALSGTVSSQSPPRVDRSRWGNRASSISRSTAPPASAKRLAPGTF